ncbi:MAG: type 4a pilus biogenesis protein PilO [Planctomycetota bacterium]
MMRDTERFTWMLLGAALAAAVAYAVVFYIPGQRMAEELRTEIRTKREYVTAASATGQALHVAKQELEKARRYDADWRQRLCRPNLVPDVHARLHDRMAAAGVAVGRFEPQTPQALSHLSVLPIEVRCKGSFAEIRKMLWQFETTPTLMWVDTLVLAPSSEDRQDVACEAKLAVFSERADSSD